MAINAPIQGTEADIIKIAMERIHRYITEHALENDIHMLLQVHDELVFEITTAKVEKAVSDITTIMESVLTSKETKGIPIIVDALAGRSWGELQKI